MGRSNINIRTLREENLKRVNKLSVEQHIEMQKEVSRLCQTTSLSFDMAMKMVLDLKEMK